MEETEQLNSNLGNKEKPLRVLHVLAVLDCGGAETRLAELWRNIDREKVHFGFCVHKDWMGYYEPEMLALGSKVFRCGPLKNLPLFSWNFYRLLKNERFDIVHVHVPTFSVVCLAISRLVGTKRRISHFRNMPREREATLYGRVSRRLLAWAVLLNATDIIGISKSVLGFWFGKDWQKKAKIRYIYNGIDLNKFRLPPEPEWFKREFNIPDGCKTVLHVGRFYPQKNHVKLVSIAENYLSRYNNSYFILAGEGPLQKEIEALVRSKGIANKFRFLCVRDDIPRIMRNADVFLFPTLWEGLGGVVIESIAAGLPMVLSDIPPIIEILDICGSAEILPVDAPDDEWADALSRAIAKPHQEQWLEELEKSPLSLENFCQNLLSLYRKIR